MQESENTPKATEQAAEQPTKQQATKEQEPAIEAVEEAAPEPSAEKAEQPSENVAEEESSQLTSEERHKLVQEVVAREIFIDPINPEEIIRAYQSYNTSPQKMIDVLFASFQNYCRKCLQETAVIEVKNELAQLLMADAETRKNQAINAIFDKVKSDSGLERLLMMLLFKNHYWQWVSFGLKEIFKEQRIEPGNSLNTYLNTRFHKLKQTKKFKAVGDLVLYDITDMVNFFKLEVMKPESRIFTQ